MYFCLDCGHMFEEPEHFIDTHGLDAPPYEERDGCPECGGAYTRTYECGCCGRYIACNYVKVDGERYCDECYRVYELGDED